MNHTQTGRDAERPGNARPRKAWERGESGSEVSGQRPGVSLFILLQFSITGYPETSNQHREWVAGFFNHQSTIDNHQSNEEDMP